jgi:hypothetical protein
MTRQEFDAKFASTCDEFNSRSDAAEINDKVFALVMDCDADDFATEQRVKSAYDRLA